VVLSSFKIPWIHVQELCIGFLVYHMGHCIRVFLRKKFLNGIMFSHCSAAKKIASDQHTTNYKWHLEAQISVNTSFISLYYLNVVERILIFCSCMRCPSVVNAVFCQEERFWMVEMDMVMFPLHHVGIWLTCLLCVGQTTITKDAIYFSAFKCRTYLTCQRKLKMFFGGRLINLRLYEDCTLLVWLKISPT
jgi:hypothetical protein